MKTGVSIPNVGDVAKFVHPSMVTPSAPTLGRKMDFLNTLDHSGPSLTPSM
jgi:hypothetical protein